MVEAVIFDMDGLLIDSEPLWHEAEKDIFKTVGLDLKTEDCLKTTGLRIDEVVRYWHCQHPWTGLSQGDVAEQIVAHMVELIAAKGKAKAGVYEVLEFMQQQNVSLALATSSSPVLIDAVVQCLGIQGVFQVIHSATAEAYGKPHPAVYITTAQRLGVEPVNCLALEDSLAGVLAAKAARMVCIAVPEAFPHQDQRFVIADYVVQSLNQVPTDVWGRVAA